MDLKDAKELYAYFGVDVELAPAVDWLISEVERLTAELATAEERGRREGIEEAAKRLDLLAEEQQRWSNFCAASVIRMEANSLRALSPKGGE